MRQSLSVVIPVYRAGLALAATCAELLDGSANRSPSPNIEVVLSELILVCDNPGLPVAELDRISGLANLDPRVRVIWLARNFGQHPATIAGIVSSNGDWVVTMDEDGQHDPTAIAAMLETAGTQRASLVYAAPTNARPHGFARNTASWISGRVARFLLASQVRFHSFRLLEGSLARSACAYAGENVFLDVALSWTHGRATSCPVRMRAEATTSSYNLHRLASHFWRMVLSTGTRPLRTAALAGVGVTLAGLVFGLFTVQQRIAGNIPVPGWTSVIITMLVLVGGLYIMLAVVAEYLGQTVRNTAGRPVYVRADPPEMRALFQLARAIDADARIQSQ